MDCNKNTQDQCCSEQLPRECTGACGKLEQELAACQLTSNDAKEKLMRLSADFENYKRRAEKERSTWVTAGQAEILRQLLPIVDNVDRALSDAGKSAQTSEMKTWLSGFQMIGDALHKFLRAHDVTEIKETQSFDPSMHEAIVSVEAQGKEAGVIVQVLEKGYLFKDQVLRPAKVSVAK